MCTRLINNQRGLASVEAVLILPLIVFIIAIIFTFTKAMQLKQEVIVQARTLAWRQALFASVPCHVVDGSEVSLLCSEDNNSGKLFLQSMIDAGAKGEGLKVGQIKKMVNMTFNTQQPGIILVSAKTQITPLANILRPFLISSQYAVDRKVYWSGDDFTLGYDEFLYKEFMHKDVNGDSGSSRLFPGFFPNVGKTNVK